MTNTSSSFAVIASNIAHAIWDMVDEWPEDYWLGLNSDWDLQLYTDDNGKPGATLYPVVNDETLIEYGTQVFSIQGEMVKKLNEQGWKLIELVEGVPVVYVGVHALAWRSEWGEPAVGFVRNED